MQVLAIKSVALRTHKVHDHLMVILMAVTLVFWPRRRLRPVDRLQLQTNEVVLLIKQMTGHHLKET